MYTATLTNNNECLINEGCVGGYGTRDIIRFSTHIRNVGDQDFYVGPPPNSPSQSDQSESWEWDECHNHWHYEGYAEYLLFDANGNQTPIGYKNGFCLIDIECDGGGTFTYTCSNQGISAGCGDIYGSGLPCQWIDVTDIADGTYSLVVRANWDGSPDANGLYESTYDNNEAKVCFNLSRASGNSEIEILGSNSCEPGTDCHDVTLTIQLDDYPQETSWRVEDANGNTVNTGGPYDFANSGTSQTSTLCLPEGCYNLVLLDSHGDGICCGYGNGSYQLSDASGNILAEGGEFAHSDTQNFCVAPPAECVDEDNDGLCAEDDCDDNDGTLPAPPGVACDDGDPNTFNDVVGADGCSCAGVACPDNDGDGICADQDCDDNNAAFPMAEGAACDDGNVNTENDLIQADGCTCAGTPIGNPLDCATINISANGGEISITGFGDFPHVNIQIFTPNWTTANSCVDNCGNGTYVTGGYGEGTHWISVKTFDTNWNFLCDILVPLEVGGGGGPCTDNDGDGYCVADDCDDNNPNLPTTIGSACDDGNSNTENDVYQNDGCTCAGTPIPGEGCDAITITPTAGLITIDGFGSFPHHNLQIFDSSWDRVFHCVDECNSPELIYLDEGLYHVSVKTFDASWSGACDIFIDVTVPGGGDPCPDNDGDGVCANQDCDDNDPGLPLAAGTTCDDGDAATINDVIQADGCSCAGELDNPAGGLCDDIIIAAGSGEITISGLEGFPHVNIQIFDPSWSLADACVDNCGNPYVLSNLGSGTYHVSVKTFDAGWNYMCDILIDLDVVSGSAPSNLILDVDHHPQGVLLQWVATDEENVFEYTLYRSTDGVQFMPISKLHPKLNNGGSVSYEYIDNGELEGKIIYQVEKMTQNFDFQYSERKEIVIDELERQFDLFPNPASDEVFVKVNVHQGLNAQILLVNSLGQLVAQQRVDALDAGMIRFDLNGLDAGIYAVYVQAADRKGMVKLLVVEPGR